MDGAHAIRALAEVDSTNAEARRRLEAGDPAPFWIMAERQVAGRGRRGRAWESLAGNLFLSGGFRLDRPPGEAALLSYAAALAVAGYLDEHAPAELVRLKWPNDVLLDGRKVAGVLLESAPSGDGVALVVGIGVNLAAAPELDDGAATCVAAHAPDARLTASAAAERVIQGFELWRSRWAKQGFAPLREAWLARAAGLGERVEARLGRETVRGTFSDLDAEGALVIATDAGERRVRAGEVFFTPADGKT
jgi:BirA family biotin operon repressor/biotin-[acetyl-CoA-carboxylase] ligase